MPEEATHEQQGPGPASGVSRHAWSDPVPPRAGTLAMVVATLLLVAISAAGSLRLWKAEPATPFAYGDDANSHALLVKAVDESGWYEHNPRLGAPFALEFHDFPMSDNLQLLATKVLGLATDDYGAIVNAYYLLTYPLVALAALWVFRRLRLSRAVAVVLAVLYAFLPYHFMRGATGHLFLVGYYVVPLGAWLAYCVLTGEPLFARHAGRRGVNRFLTVETVRTVAICLVIGATSGYYAFFTTVIVAGAAIIRLARAERPRTALAAVVVLAAIAASQAANLAPDLLYRRAHGPNHAVARRAASESEFYSLKLAQLVLPQPYHRIDSLASLRQEYGGTFPLPSEGAQVAVGAVAAVGVVWLLGLAVIGPLRRPRHTGDRTGDAEVGADDDATGEVRTAALSTLTLFTFLVATVGGLSTFVALFMTTQVRAWNRLSIFIAFFAMAGVGVLLDRLGRQARRDRRRHVLWHALLVAVLLVGLADQTSDSFIPDYPGVGAEFASDAAFVTGIERTLPAGSMVFQLPIVPFPEWPPVHRMTDYSHLKGYLHSHSLRWSYGGMKGREADWQVPLGGKPTKQILDALAAVGFRGLYIDRFGYPDNGASLEQEVGSLLGTAPVVSDNGRLAFFDLRAYEHLARDRWGEDLDRVASVVLHPTRLGHGDGFFHQEGDATTNWRWARQGASLMLHNPSRTPRRVRVEMGLATSGGGPSTAMIAYPDGTTRTVTVSATRTVVSYELDLPPGTAEIGLATDAPRVHAPNERRDIHLQVVDPKVHETVLERFVTAAH